MTEQQHATVLFYDDGGREVFADAADVPFHKKAMARLVVIVSVTPEDGTIFASLPKNNFGPTNIDFSGREA